MLKTSLLVLALSATSAGAAQTTPAPAAEPAAAPTATTGAGSAQPLPRCSAEMRDRCLQDERFARDVAAPGGSRDNNALHYPTSRAAERRGPTR